MHTLAEACVCKPAPAPASVKDAGNFYRNPGFTQTDARERTGGCILTR